MRAAGLALALVLTAGCGRLGDVVKRDEPLPPPRAEYRGVVPQASPEDARHRKAATQPRDCGAELREGQDLHLSLIEEMLEQGLFHAALAHLDALEPKARDAPRAQYLRAEALRRSGDMSAARPVYAALLTTCLGGLGHFGLGRIAASQCELDQAQLDLEQARERRPVDARIANDLGMVYFARGDLTAAQQSFQTAVELARGQGPATRNLLHVLVRREHWSDAERMARQYGVGLGEIEALREAPVPDLGCAKAAKVQ